MSLNGRLDALRSKHAGLDEGIARAQQCPSFCSTKLRKMKAEKLRLKDEIARLEGAVQPNSPEQPDVPEVSATVYDIYEHRGDPMTGGARPGGNLPESVLRRAAAG